MYPLGGIRESSWNVLVLITIVNEKKKMVTCHRFCLTVLKSKSSWNFPAFYNAVNTKFSPRIWNEFLSGETVLRQDIISTWNRQTFIVFFNIYYSVWENWQMNYWCLKLMSMFYRTFKAIKTSLKLDSTHSVCFELLSCWTYFVELLNKSEKETILHKTVRQMEQSVMPR